MYLVYERDGITSARLHVGSGIRIPCRHVLANVGECRLGLGFLRGRGQEAVSPVTANCLCVILMVRVRG